MEINRMMERREEMRGERSKSRERVSWKGDKERGSDGKEDGK